MNVLLLRPVPANERFGLGPFFRIEPLGMEYIAAALEARGHRVTLVDLRFRPSLGRSHAPLAPGARRHRGDARARNRRSGRARRSAFERCCRTCRSSSAATPRRPIRRRFSSPPVTAVVLDDGERAMPAICDAIAGGVPLAAVPGLALRDRDGGVVRTQGEIGTLVLDEVPLPARHHVESWRGQYACLAHRPAYLVETARGCPFRCSFCSIWQVHARTVRERSIDSVCRDFASVGDHVFVADDLFWHHPPRSLELARELRRRGIRKNWILVQSRTDLVARHPELLEAWRPLAKDFDIFFGLEAATDEGLERPAQGCDRRRDGSGVGRRARERVRRDRKLRHRSGVDGAGLRTPVGIRRAAPAVPGRVHDPDAAAGHRVFRGDAGHAAGAALGRISTCTTCSGSPRSGPRRFFELYCETWRRSVLNLSGRKGLLQWLREVDLAQRAVPGPRPAPHAAADGRRPLPGRAHARALRRLADDVRPFRAAAG